MLFRDVINQILVGISRSPRVVLVQFRGGLLISVVGSKIENRFIVIFSLFFDVDGSSTFSCCVWGLCKVVYDVEY
jgi:hypothetical protein